jgi:N-acetylneuraminic acid mutarotase
MSRLDIYDPASGKWSLGKPLLTARQAAACAVLDGRLYALGGAGLAGDTDALASVEVYDSKTGQWVTAPPMPTARMCLGAAAVDRTIYAVGGKDAKGRFLGTLEAMKPDGAWITLSRLPRPVSGPFVAARNGVIYVAGGLAGPDDVTDSLQAYTVATDRWTVLAPMPGPRFDGCGAQWVGGLLIVLGGWTYPPDEALPHDDVFVYDPARNVWRK